MDRIWKFPVLLINAYTEEEKFYWRKEENSYDYWGKIIVRLTDQLKTLLKIFQAGAKSVLDDETNLIEIHYEKLWLLESFYNIPSRDSDKNKMDRDGYIVTNDDHEVNLLWGFTLNNDGGYVPVYPESEKIRIGSGDDQDIYVEFACRSSHTMKMIYSEEIPIRNLINA